MNCADVRLRMIEAVYDELPTELQTAFDKHLGGCAECRLAYEQLAETDSLLDAASDESARVDLDRMYRAMAERGTRSAQRWRRLAMAAAALLLVAIGLAVWRGRVQVGPDRLVISWRETAAPAPAQPPSDPGPTLADHARHLATLDDTIAMLVAELDANERQRLETLSRLHNQLQAFELQNNTRINLVQRDIHDLYLASFPSTENESGGQP